jgi:hypothetical protein
MYEVMREKSPNNFAGVTAMKQSQVPTNPPSVTSNPCNKRLIIVKNVETLLACEVIALINFCHVSAIAIGPARMSIKKRIATTTARDSISVAQADGDV